MVSIVVAIIGATGCILGFLQFMINRHDKNFEGSIDKKIDALTEKIDFVAQGCTRTQLMVLMKHFEDRPDEIMKVAEKYFVSIGGNWYMGTLFKDWCEKNGHELPSWYSDNI